MYRLHYAVQNYDWGKKASESILYELITKSNEKSNYPEDKPYAEIWMGAHSSLPSKIELENDELVSLSDFIKDKPELVLGAAKEKYQYSQLPFLFKVLSVQKSLSIQAHPDKKLGEMLHKQFPDIYKDPNHKPEMAVALTDFHALCNFAPLDELQTVFKTYEAFAKVFDAKTVENFLQSDESNAKQNLKQIIKEMFDKDVKDIENAVGQIVKSIEGKQQRTPKEELVLKLQTQFPNDIGILFALLLNYLVLKPGEALVLEANEPHAYIYGECVESMASSDNVVRCGLTPKLKDKNTLCDMLTYKMFKTDIKYGQVYYDKEKYGYELKVYNTQYNEFYNVRVSISKPVTETVEITFTTPSIFIVVEGEGEINYKVKSSPEKKQLKLSKGISYFVLPYVHYSFKSADKVDQSLTVFICASQS